MLSDQEESNFFAWLHDNEDSWHDEDGELLSQSPDQQPLQSSVLSWLASKSKLREQKKTENLAADISPHYQERGDPDEMPTAVFVYPSPSSNNESSGLETSNDAAFEGSDLIVHNVDGDVMDYLREFRSEEHQDISDNGDMAQSSLQVSIPDFLDEEDIIHGDGGVIYIVN